MLRSLHSYNADGMLFAPNYNNNNEQMMNFSEKIEISQLAQYSRLLRLVSRTRSHDLLGAYCSLVGASLPVTLSNRRCDGSMVLETSLQMQVNKSHVAFFLT